MQQNQHTINTNAMCEMLDVVRSGYYAWKKSPQSARETEDIRLTDLIKKSFDGSRKTYSRRRIKDDLNEWGEKISKRRIGKLMSPILFGSVILVPRVGITYIWTNEGWFYLATVIDLYSRKIVGRSMADNMKTQLVNDALQIPTRGT
ncbi:MAG: hypothetical protein QX203_19135, partial [Methylococcaceae bacterium]